MAGFREQAVTRASFDNVADFAVERDPSASVREFAHNGRPAQRLTQLARTIELEVVPRLVLAQRGASVPPPSDRDHPTTAQVREFARLSLGRDPSPVATFVETLRDQGMPIETLYLELLAPAARHLGELWTDDLCSFSEVTLGLMRLQQVMRALSPAFLSECASGHRDHCALLTPVPGEQHSFGLFMVAEFLYRAGWQIWSGPLASLDELIAAVDAQWFAVAGLSVSSDAKLDTLVAAIRAIRRASCNPGIGVMVGGQIFSEHPEIARKIGADATAADGPQAVVVAQGLLDLRARA